MTSEFLNAARKVFEIKRKPMHPREIVAEGIREGLFTDKIAGKTPYQTMKSKLSVNIRRLGSKSEFVRTAPGVFYLRKLLEPSQDIYQAPPIKMPTSGEDVLLFNSTILDQHGRFQGIKKSWKHFYRALEQPDVCSYRDRISAETDNNHKQVLTYVMVTRKGSVLTYKRGSYNRVEDFLRGCQCIGFGGHVVLKDRDLFSDPLGLVTATARELSEELKLPPKDVVRLGTEDCLRCVGILNDDSSTVGQRHFAFLFQYEVSSDSYWNKPERGEKSITQLQWLDRNSSPQHIWLFEYWSQLCLREFFAPLVKTLSAYRIIRKKPLTPPHLLCISGEVGSGKSEATKMFCENLGYKEINTGKIVGELIKLKPVPQTPREEFQQQAWNFIRSKTGPRVLAQAIGAKVQKLNHPRIIIDGIRQRETLEALKRCCATKIGVLFIHTLPDLAYEFYRTRERRETSVFDFLAIRRVQVESEVRGMIDISDAIVYNWKGRSDYLVTIRRLFNDLL